MWVIVLMADEDALAGAPHPILLIVLLQALESSQY